MSRPERTARHAAMDLLARREHGRRELQRKLERRYSADEIDEVVGVLSEEGLQSDERFAASFARERMLRGYGPRRIQSELLKKGISGSLADQAIRTLERSEGVSWRRVARDALKKKFGDSELPEEYAERARCLRFLQNRGFAGDDTGDDDL